MFRDRLLINKETVIIVITVSLLIKKVSAKQTEEMYRYTQHRIDLIPMPNFDYRSHNATILHYNS